MAEESHVYNAVFKAQGVQEVLAGLGRLGTGFQEVFEALNRLSRVDPINIGEFRGTAAVINAQKSLEQLQAAHAATVDQIIAKDRELSRISQTHPTLAREAAERQRQQIIRDAEAAAASRMATLGQNVNRLLTEQAKPVPKPISEQALQAALQPRYDPTDTSAVGRLTRRRSELDQNLEKVNAELLKATQEARTGVIDEAAHLRNIAALVNRQLGIEAEITKNKDLVRTAAGEQAVAEQRAAQQASLGPLGRARGEFMLGFKGERDLSYAQQVGQAFKFSVFYGTAYKLLFAFTQTLQQTLQEGIAFQQGMTDLAIAAGRNKDQLQDLGERLGATAAAAGAAPSQGVEIGARAIGLYGASGASQAEQERVAEISARVVSRMAVGSPIAPVDLQAQVAAITQALGLGTAGQFRVADLDAFLTKRFGAPQGSTLEAVSQSASVGRAAGFTDEQLFALAADLISRTGQSSTAVGGYLAQIFSRGGEGSLTDVAQRYNIDTTQTLAEITKQLAQVYAGASPNQRAEISAAFGRGKIQNAAVALLGDYNEVLASASDAKTGASGAADKQFTARINDIGGQINLLSGSLKEFAHLLGESGILSLLGLGVVTFRELLDAVNSVLALYNQLPSALKDLIGAFVAAEIAFRLAGKGGVIQGVAGLATSAGVGRTARLGRLLAGYGATEASATAGAAAAAGGAGIAGAAVAALPVAAVAAAVFGLTSVIDTMNKQREADKASVAVLGAADAPGVGSASSAYRAQAESLQAVAKQQRDATGWVAQAVSFGHANDAALKTAEQLDKEAKRLNAVADAIDQRPQDKVPTFASLDDKGIATGFDQITRSGGTAREQLKALNEAIYGLGDAAIAAKGRIDVGEQATQINRDLVEGVTGYENIFGDVNYGHVSGDKVKKAIRDQLSGKRIQARLKEQLDALGVTNIGQLTPEQIDEIATNISKLDFGTDTSLGKLTQGQTGVQAKIQKTIRDNIVNGFTKQVDDLRAVYGKDATISVDKALSEASALIDRTAANLDLLPETDYGGRAKLLQAEIRGLRFLNRKAGRNIPQVNDDIRAAQKALAANEVEQLEELRHVAVANAKTQRQATAAAAPIIRREIQAAVKAGDRDLLAKVLSLAGKSAIRIARDVINEAIAASKEAATQRRNMERAAQLMREAMAEAITAYKGALAAVPDIFNTGGVQPGTVLVPKPKVGPKQKELEGLLQQTYQTTPATNPDAIPGGTNPQETAEERRAARLAAEAARKGGEIAPARAAVAQALAELHKAKKGTVEYYNALASYYQARDELNEAFRNYRHILRELKIDTTDPLAEANLTLAEARRKLRQDARRGKGRDVLAQDRLDVKNARNEQEATAFSQRLEDVQTNEELGRISHAAYMRYLQSEHNRLTAIAHRTRQQQDQLNQVDKLMKDAASEMQGAFNIGDIKLPTPYEVRRYIKTQVSATPYSLGPNATTGTTTIYINGADTGAVRRIIDDTVGKGTRVLTTTTRRT